MRTLLLTSLIVVSRLFAPCIVESAESDALRIATFSVDITTPTDRPVGLGFIPTLKTVEHPLLARGVLLIDSHEACVICSLDWMEVHNESYDFLRRTIAEAAGVQESHVALHCLHQHTAPAMSTAAQRLQLDESDERRVATAEYLLDVSKKLSGAIRTAKQNMQQVTRLGTGKTRVDRVASNRRIEKADGSIQGRGSNTKTAAHLRELPEGVIDPFVRTVSFENAAGAVAHLHYYASHPQSFYGDGRASYDVPGIIRKQLEAKTGVFQLYLTGCGGDVAFGKYNDGSRRARDELTARLQFGIEKSIADLKHSTVSPLKWTIRGMTFPLRTDAAFSESANRKILEDADAAVSSRRKAAINLAWIERVKSGRPVELSCLSIGAVQMLHLPGEPFVQFQLAAQRMRPDGFVCVAGYGDCGMGYIGGDRIFNDRGGYEQTYSFAGPSENLFFRTIRELLTGQTAEKNP